MTQSEYLTVRGTQCPYCHSQDVEGSEVDINEGGATQEIGCNTCNAEWIDTYTLTGYMEV
ncbi:hypothetical protein [Dyella sp. ASV21]|uniref:hypothetical protein n=1 Tax=Dyella sp. ASV21 TaxID=2795114 RepID=UPI0018EB9B2D|nr:hypothetical protein [Dyella sp. ASV21]